MSEKRKIKTEASEGPSKKVNVGGTDHYFEVQPEVENFQREALWRSLQEYKRRSLNHQEQLEKLQQRTKWHNEHIRLVDVWWKSLLTRLAELTGVSLDEREQTESLSKYLQAATASAPALKKEDAAASTTALDAHLATVSKTCIEAFERYLNAAHAVGTDDELRSRLEELSVLFNDIQTKYQTLEAEHSEREGRIGQLEDKLASALRKVDRQKSITLARIEASARKAGHSTGSPAPDSADKTNGTSTTGAAGTATPGASSAPSEEQLKEAQKQQQELTDLRNDRANIEKRLADLQASLFSQQQLTQKLEAQLSELDESTVKGSIPYKALALVNEQLRGSCEATESSLAKATAELETLKAERQAFRTQAQQAHHDQQEELSQRLSRTEQDLARVRGNRDELHAGLQQRKAQDESRITATQEISELADSLQSRVEALELENARLKGDQETKQPNGDDEREKLKAELSVMEKAFKQAVEQSSRRIMELANVEERIGRLQAEKAKADQKYFAAMKAKDQVTFELKALKLQVMKGGEAIQRYTESDEALQRKVQLLEKRAATEEKLHGIAKHELARLEQALTQSKALADERATSLSGAETRLTQANEQAASLSSRLTTLEEQRKRDVRDLERYRAAETAERKANSAAGMDADQLQVYRSMALCSVCNLRWKDTTITSCGHVFCRDCVDKRIETRQRRCPNCNKGFGANDVLAVHL
ncbi:E3 ubiquitin-protein ligase bre1 [Savitreella phatthalungensis]